MSYKWCLVPACKNTSIKTPDKLFVCVPKNVKMRKKWLQLARRNSQDISNNSVVYFCEDHFDMEKDMVNYGQFKQGFSQRIIMADRVLPSKFNCQEDRRTRMCDDNLTRPALLKREKIQLIQDLENIQPIDTTQENISKEAYILGL